MNNWIVKATKQKHKDENVKVFEMPFYDFIKSERHRFIQKFAINPDVMYASEEVICYLIQTHQITIREKDLKNFFCGCEVRLDKNLCNMSFGFSKINHVPSYSNLDLDSYRIFVKGDF